LPNQSTIPKFVWADLDKPRKISGIDGSSPQIRNLGRDLPNKPILHGLQHYGYTKLLLLRFVPS